MADKQNPGYIEQLKEMRALRTQQLRGMNADQRFYANMNANQKALIVANQKLAASFDSMSKTFVSSLRGLTSAVGGLASKGASAAGGVASGVGSIAGSITSGLGKVLPFAITGIVSKMLIWDNLTGENKNRLTSSVARLFSSLFGDLPDMFRGIVQKIIGSISSMDIKFPILTTITQKTEAFLDMFSAGLNILKLKFEELTEFFKGIKDPAKLFESGIKALGYGTLARLLLPATVSLLTSIISNRFLMHSIGNLLDSRGFGVPGGGVGRGRAGGAGGSGKAGAAAASGMFAKIVNAAKSVGRGVGRLLLLTGVAAEALAIGLTVYWLYDVVKQLFPDASDDEINELIEKAKAANTTGALEYVGEVKPDADEAARIEKAKKLIASAKPGEKDFKPFIPGDPQSEASVEEHNRKAYELKQAMSLMEKAKRFEDQRKLEDSSDSPAFVVSRFKYFIEGIDDNEREYLINTMYPIVQTANYVYYLGKDGKMARLPVEEYKATKKKLAEMIPIGNKEEILKQTADLVKKYEPGKEQYNAVYGEGEYGKPSKNLTEMTGQEVLDYQEQLRKATAGKIGKGDEGTTAVGAYQLTKSYATGPYYEKHTKELGLPFNEEQQDKIYRWFINGAVDKLIATGDTEAFKKEVMGKWEIFKKPGKDGNPSAAQNELNAMFSNPSYNQASMVVEDPKTKEQRDAQLKIEQSRLEDARKRLMSPGGDTTLMTIKGISAVELAKDKATEFKNNLLDYIGDPGTLRERAERFFNPNQEQLDDLKKNMDQKTSLIVNNIDNSTQVASTGGDGGGSRSPGFNNIVSSPYDKYYRFNSLAGGNPVA